MSEELKKAILDFFEKNSAKNKKKHYANDVAKGLEGSFSRGDVKRKIQELLDAGELKIWSSGSTTYLMLPKDWEEQQGKETGE